VCGNFRHQNSSYCAGAGLFADTVSFATGFYNGLMGVGTGLTSGGFGGGATTLYVASNSQYWFISGSGGGWRGGDSPIIGAQYYYIGNAGTSYVNNTHPKYVSHTWIGNGSNVINAHGYITLTAL